MLNVNFKFPIGCDEPYGEAELPCLPRIGDIIQASRPQSGAYRVKNVIFGMDDERLRCDCLTVELEALDKVSGTA
jgi:hypothetical protein